MFSYKQIKSKDKLITTVAMDLTKVPRKVWEHPDPKSTAMWAFMQEANRIHGLNLKV